MKNFPTRTLLIFAALVTLMAVTRFNHFGSVVSLPDASIAVFFLGGIYLTLFTRASVLAFATLIIEAGLIDYYATSVQGISDWCMTPAYWFLIPTYGTLWLTGELFAPEFAVKGHIPQGKSLIMLALLVWASCSFAFLFSNAAFYSFSGHFVGMNATEYAAQVAQYYVPYVAVALLYIACAVALHIAFVIIAGRRAHSRPDVT